MNKPKPTIYAPHVIARWKMIERRLKKGDSASDIARELGISRARVYQLAEKAKKNVPH